MNKLDARMALSRLEGGARDLLGFGHEYGRANPSKDAALVRRFMNAERHEILILRRYVLFGASELEWAGYAQPTAKRAEIVAEMREAAKPKRRK